MAYRLSRKIDSSVFIPRGYILLLLLLKKILLIFLSWFQEPRNQSETSMDKNMKNCRNEYDENEKIYAESVFFI